MGTFFCLADPVDPKHSRLSTPIRKSPDGMTFPVTYDHARKLLTYLVEDYNVIRLRYQKPGYPEPPIVDPKVITVHSPKGWLDTLAIQADFEDKAIDILCHWNQKKMSLLYNKNFIGV